MSALPEGIDRRSISLRDRQKPDKRTAYLLHLWHFTQKYGVTEKEWLEFIEKKYGVKHTKEMNEKAVRDWELRLASSNTKEDLLWMPK